MKLFLYGSLLKSSEREKYFKDIPVEEFTIPASAGYHRVWKNRQRDYTTLCILKSKKPHDIVGLVISLNKRQIAKLDARERGLTRRVVYNDIECYFPLGKDYVYNNIGKPTKKQPITERYWKLCIEGAKEVSEKCYNNMLLSSPELL